MRTLVRLTVSFLTLALVVTAQAADDPTGTWTWTMERQGQTREVTLKLKLDGDKLTGSMPGRNNTETAITDGKYKDGELSFSVVREFNGNKMTSKYSGKVSGDSIKGKIETERGDQKMSRDWEAKKQK